MSEEYKLGGMIFSQNDIEKRATEIGSQISNDYQGKKVVLIGILKGAVVWMSQVMKSIENVDISIEFMAVSSYGASTQSSGIVKINKDIDSDISDRHVIIIEDIVDTGITLDYLSSYIMGKNPASVKICTLLDKPAGRQIPIHVDYVGFEIDDYFVVGYGLDLNQEYRNLPYIAFMEKVE